MVGPGGRCAGVQDRAGPGVPAIAPRPQPPVAQTDPRGTGTGRAGDIPVCHRETPTGCPDPPVSPQEPGEHRGCPDPAFGEQEGAGALLPLGRRVLRHRVTLSLLCPGFSLPENLYLCLHFPLLIHPLL